jgi:hypothetical protein
MKINATIDTGSPFVDLRVPRDEEGKTFEQLQLTRGDFATWVQQAGTTRVAAAASPWIDLLMSSGIALRTLGNGDVEVLKASPSQVRTFPVGTHGSSRSYTLITVRTPPLLWFLTYRAERLVRSHLLVSQDRPLRSLRDPVILQVWPFGHAQEPEGAICWGDTPWQTLPLSDPQAVENVFFQGGINEHLCIAPGMNPRYDAIAGLRGWGQTNKCLGKDLQTPVVLTGDAPVLPLVWEAGRTCRIVNLQNLIGRLPAADTIGAVGIREVDNGPEEEDEEEED